MIVEVLLPVIYYRSQISLDMLQNTLSFYELQDIRRIFIRGKDSLGKQNGAGDYRQPRQVR